MQTLIKLLQIEAYLQPNSDNLNVRKLENIKVVWRVTRKWINENNIK